jgi:signal peptidase I
MGCARPRQSSTVCRDRGDAARLPLVFELVLLTLGLRLFLVEPYQIPSSSMWPTLEVRDQFFVSKFARVPDYGDIVIFRSPSGDGQVYAKRVVALAGDEIEFAGSQPVINGWKVPSCSIGPLAYQDEAAEVVHQGEGYVEFLGRYAYVVFEEHQRNAASIPRFRVPPDQVFVVGDNRFNSHDSRYWNRGQPAGVSSEDVQGRVSLVWFAVDGKGNVNSDRVPRQVGDRPSLPVTATAESKRKLAECLILPPRQTRPPKGSRR